MMVWRVMWSEEIRLGVVGEDFKIVNLKFYVSGKKRRIWI